MKYFHLLGDKKPMFEAFINANKVQLQNDFANDFVVLRATCLDIVNPLIQASDDEEILTSNLATMEALNELYAELLAEHEQHVIRVKELKERLKESIW